MAQFDVHRNPGRSRTLYPYLLEVQSNFLRRSDRRVVIPLGAIGPGLQGPDPRLNPILEVEGSRVLLATQEITNISMDALGEVVCNLRAHADTIVGALDWLLSQGFD